jgi:hypothetical protein
VNDCSTNEEKKKNEYKLLYSSRLVPRPLAIWGLAAICLLDWKGPADNPCPRAGERQRPFLVFTAATLTGCGGPSAEELEAVNYTPLPGGG